MRWYLCILAIVATAMSDPNLEAILKSSNDQFSAHMFQEVANSQNGESFVLSAFSVLSPLAQLALASVGKSHDEILAAIGFPNDNIEVEKHTHSHIKNLLTPGSILPDTTAALVNAIYFKGKWSKPFNKYLTENQSFHVTKDLTSPVPMMYQSGHFKYAHIYEFDAKFLEMEYEGGDASLVLALPNKIDGIEDLIKKCKDPTALNKAFASMYIYKVRVTIPKFTIETNINLKEVLEKLNIKRLFQANKAKLYNLLKEVKDLYITNALQKAYIEVNEKGVVATAANVFSGIGGLAYYHEEYLEFKADHPFMFFIMENKNILFSGVYRS